MAVTQGVRRSTDRPWLGQWNSAATSYYLLVGATGLLLVIGLVMVFSSSTVTSIAAGDPPWAEGLEQARFALIGVPLAVVATRIPVRWYRRMAWPALITAVALQSLTLVPALARGAGGNVGWIYLGGGLSLQPAEVSKLALALWLGFVLGRKQHLLGSWGHALVPAVPGALVVLGLVMAGNDLGTVLVMAGLVAGALWVAGAPTRLLGLGALAATFVVGFFFVYGNSNRMGRILTVYSGCTDTQDECYQSLHGLWGLGTGGLFGVGLGASREKWRYLPEAHNDFIYAVIGEELGLLGTLLVLALFAVLGVAMARVVRRHPDPFVKITTAAVACWVVGQAFLNIGVVVGVFPVIGVPLPLVSAGGSALVATVVALGMVISFARSEPGAPEAFAARGGAVRRSLTVLGRGRRAGR
ncbi:cell division-specific peptidoglycan biosynthesis regulator FtsW [Isoptericola sp. CG 20/1183]|uniref:Probable peptidoglycan glycosyltransferase FtsW n=1 Tax=Isoptericola halotolerans TaxID=300560 RepID=A0ABX5ECL4_9MICO|nr:MULTISPECIES: FtsW/RodA/SpoVE family cell cycle protein [Isoptericola]MCK0116609.1 FtsW/RodA/SpoVE family cell cycle protein [Isoptericola sp. S6320L]PRZ05576.1 cell division-specific peptidoglycan biosynthesis regulator FtsW [Isoptericola halotolerans]PRZ06144.1 cell division-specific peptidoglycan biosynthesis regulator FtsW [Isoptericola sp. CG 20/1183]